MAEGRKQAEVDRLRAELRAIKAERRGAPTLIESAMPKAEDVRRLARQRAGGTVLQFLRPDVFWAAEARASRAAIAAAAKGDFEGAILAKRQELWARAMFRELATARDDVRARTDALRQLTTKAAQERIGKRGGGHLAQIYGLLDQSGLAPVPEKSWPSAPRSMSGSSIERGGASRPRSPGRSGPQGPVDVKTLTVDQVRTLTDAIRTMEHWALEDGRFSEAMRKQGIAVVAAEATESVRSHFRGKPRQVARDRNPSAQRKRSWGDYFAAQRTLTSICRQLDGWRDGGVMTSHVMFLLDKAGAALEDRKVDAHQALAALRVQWLGRTPDLYTRTFLPEVGQSFSRMERLMVVLNWGSESSRRVLQRGETWGGNVQPILDSLSHEELQFVQGVLDLVGAFAPELDALHRRQNGVPMTRVEPAESWRPTGRFAGATSRSRTTSA